MNIQNLNLGLSGKEEYLAKQMLERELFNELEMDRKVEMARDMIAEMDDDTTDLENQEHDEQMEVADLYFEREPQW